MRQEHRAGEKCFMDFSGDGLQVVDAASGEERVAKLYVWRCWGPSAGGLLGVSATVVTTASSTRRTGTQ